MDPRTPREHATRPLQPDRPATNRPPAPTSNNRPPTNKRTHPSPIQTRHTLPQQPEHRQPRPRPHPGTEQRNIPSTGPSVPWSAAYGGQPRTVDRPRKSAPDGRVAACRPTAERRAWLIWAPARSEEAPSRPVHPVRPPSPLSGRSVANISSPPLSIGGVGAVPRLAERNRQSGPALRACPTL